MPECGSYAGCQAHYHRGEKPCGPCRAAASAYQRSRYAANPRARDKQLAYQRARARATARLIAAHRGEYVRLLAEERAREKEG